MPPKKPLMILESPLTGKFYATRAYKKHENYVECTGQKEDVTEQIEAIIRARSIK